jgi:succinate dehydrogenase / fumarate reductase cytochrome b subunit
MGSIGQFYRSTLGKKAVMAVTGLLLFGFVLVHMAGNLKLYMGKYEEGAHAGEYAINVYGHWLRELGSPALPHGAALWIFRVVLLVAVLLHMHCAWVLTRQSWAARPVDYRKRDVIQATYASRTVRWGGVIILLFLLYHLAHLTLGVVGPAGFVHLAPYQNLVLGFQVPWIAGFYVAANLMLGLHLYHGLWSMFQSLGWSGPTLNPWRKRFAVAFAAIVTAGNLSFPLAVLGGLVR